MIDQLCVQVCSSIVVSVIPVMIIHLRGQYEILAKYVSLIGHQHRDMLGFTIFYSDIERNEYVTKLYTPGATDAPTLGGNGLAPVTPPLSGNNFAPPMRGNKFAPLLRGNRFAPPLRENRFAPPLGGNNFASPLRENNFAPILRGKRFAPQLKGNRFAQFLKRNRFAPPLRENIFAPPLGGDRFAPVTAPLLRENRFRQVAQRLIRQRAYERDYVRQIIGFHKKLHAFEEKVSITSSFLIKLMKSCLDFWDNWAF